ncbi:MAG: NAD-dependent epimerase [Thermomicrobiales bacterium]
MSRNRILLTGAAGFIGFHVSQRLLARGDDVIGLDSLNDYYDVSLKEARLAQLTPQANFRFVHANLADNASMTQTFANTAPTHVINLAAQAGVRYSLTNPHAYAESNLSGFLNVLEGARAMAVEHLVFASSSSVYGGNTKLPFATDDMVDHPLSLYAATKKANELMAHSYAHLYQLPMTGLRFFNVYGPWGRPDAALTRFTGAMLAGEPINVYNYGHHRRDFTYVDDIAESIVRVLDQPAAPDPAWDSANPRPSTSNAPYRIFNIGNSQPVELLYLIQLLEAELGVPAVKNLLPMQPGDVEDTIADVAELESAIGFAPSTPIETGVSRYVAWYRSYYGDGGKPG